MSTDPRSERSTTPAGQSESTSAHSTGSSRHEDQPVYGRVRPPTIPESRSTSSVSPERRVSKRAVAGALGLTALLGGGVAVTASRTQDASEQFVRTLSTALQASGVATVEQTTYRRGLSSSLQTMRVALGGSSPVRLMVINRIQHGPVPGFRSVGQALVDTEIRFEDAAVQAQVNRAFAGRKPVIRTLVGLSGATHTRLDIPAGQVAQEGATLRWEPLVGTVRIQGPNTTTDLQWPGLVMSSEGGTGEVRGVSVRGTTRRAARGDQVGLGRSELKVEALGYTAGTQRTALEQLAVTSESRLNGKDHYDLQVSYRGGSLWAAGLSLKDLQLQLDLRHLARAPLNRIVALVNAARSGAAASASDGRSTLTATQLQQLQQDLLGVLQGNPEIRLERLSLTQPAGDVILQARVTAPGAARLNSSELGALLASPANVMGLLEAQMDFQGSRQAVQQLLRGAPGQGAALAGSLDELIEGGLLEQRAGQLSAQLRLEKGDLNINGRSLADF